MWFVLLSFVAAEALSAPEILERLPDSASQPPVLTLLYSGEQRGDVGPCGCDAVPRGGLGRLARVTQEIEETSAAISPVDRVLSLNTGAWLSSALAVGELSEGAHIDNRWFHEALSLVPYDVLNVTPKDLPSLVPRSGLVSATHRPPPAGGVEVSPYETIAVGDLRVVVTGVSRDTLTYLQPEGTEVLSPVQAVRDQVAALSGGELVVVLVYDLPKEATLIAEIPGVDVVIEASAYTERWPMRIAGEAVVVRSRDAGASLGVLSLWVDAQGELTAAHDESVRLDERTPSDRRIDRVERRQQKERRQNLKIGGLYTPRSVSG